MALLTVCSYSLAFVPRAFTSAATARGARQGPATRPKTTARPIQRFMRASPRKWGSVRPECDCTQPAPEPVAPLKLLHTLRIATSARRCKSCLSPTVGACLERGRNHLAVPGEVSQKSEPGQHRQNRGGKQNRALAQGDKG